MYILRAYQDGDYNVTEYTVDGVNVSHTVRELIQSIVETPAEHPPGPTLDERVATLEDTMNFMLLGGM